MNTFWMVVGWLFAVLFGVLLVSMLLMKNWSAALALLLVVLLCLPPVNSWLASRFGLALHPLLRALLVIGLLVLFGRLLTAGGQDSIYASDAVEAQFTALYDEKMEAWPVPYEDRLLETEYGTVYVIVSGPEHALPLLLLHASGVASWSWKYNIEGLSQSYRVFAIDLIGDVGKSKFTTLDHILETGEDQARLYAEIADQLEIDKAYVVGASDGGFIASNYARYFPERVEKLALLGPMGYAGANRAVTRIMAATFFPLKPIQESTFSWAFSDSPELEADFGEWFRLVMTGYKPSRVAPLPLKPEERQSIQAPTLFVFGTHDNLVGDPAVARQLVQDMPDVRVEVVDAGHLMAGERPEEVNALVLEHFAKE